MHSISALRSFTLTLIGDFYVCNPYHGVSRPWSGLPGNPNHRSPYSPDNLETSVLYTCIMVPGRCSPYSDWTMDCKS